MLDTKPLLKNTDFPQILRGQLTTLQVNLGYLCNQTCTHCHVNAGPKRTELASLQTVEDILMFMRNNNIETLDITGGAPEMNPHFKYLVQEAKGLNVEIIDRCNLTILNEPGYEDIAGFLAEYQVNVTASLPCYQEDNVNQQRGNGVFQSSISALKKLNTLGYGRTPELRLNLVYNPNGTFLPPDQNNLQESYKQHLKREFDIDFHQLFTLANMPIQRFGGMLLAKGLYDDYMALLKNSYMHANLANVMCLHLLSIDWQGYVYDCDFNQMLHWPLKYDGAHIASDKNKIHLRELIDRDLTGNPIIIGEHCYACTAGQGSSCGGALSS